VTELIALLMGAFLQPLPHFISTGGLAANMVGM
jgi:hypothetical protein